MTPETKTKTKIFPMAKFPVSFLVTEVNAVSVSTSFIPEGKRSGFFETMVFAGDPETEIHTLTKWNFDVESAVESHKAAVEVVKAFQLFGAGKGPR